jgi:hypothetical protein
MPTIRRLQRDRSRRTGGLQTGVLHPGRPTRGLQRNHLARRDPPSGLPPSVGARLAQGILQNHRAGNLSRIRDPRTSRDLCLGRGPCTSRNPSPSRDPYTRNPGTSPSLYMRDLCMSPDPGTSGRGCRSPFPKGLLGRITPAIILIQRR